VTRLMMVMGIQRSGTNALFRALSADPALVSFNESDNGPWYDKMFLRPETELRVHLSSIPGPVLLKPISETKRRSVRAVLDEFEAYRPQVVWIYRDPVNCFYSHTERWSGFVGDPAGFVSHWCHRNQMLLDAVSDFTDQIAVIRYGDLIADPHVFGDLQTKLGVQGRYRFRADRAAGRRDLDRNVQECIDSGCAPTLRELDQARSFTPSATPLYTRLLANIRG
jgi:hypothetical protein